MYYSALCVVFNTASLWYHPFSFWRLLNRNCTKRKRFFWEKLRWSTYFREKWMEEINKSRWGKGNDPLFNYISMHMWRPFQENGVSRWQGEMMVFYTCSLNSKTPQALKKSVCLTRFLLSRSWTSAWDAYRVRRKTCSLRWRLRNTSCALRFGTSWRNTKRSWRKWPRNTRWRCQRRRSWCPQSPRLQTCLLTHRWTRDS